MGVWLWRVPLYQLSHTDVSKAELSELSKRDPVREPARASTEVEEKTSWAKDMLQNLGTFDLCKGDPGLLVDINCFLRNLIYRQRRTTFVSQTLCSF